MEKRKREEVDEEPNKKICKVDYSDIVTVVVGNDAEQRLFRVHTDIISHHSPYFKAACSNVWSEGRERKVSLPEQCPISFRVYVDGLYKGKDADVAEIVREVLMEGESTVNRFRVTALGRLCQVWVLADYLGDAGFKDKVMAKIHHGAVNRDLHGACCLLYAATIGGIFAKTSSGCALQRFWIDRCVQVGLGGVIYDLSDEELCGSEFAFAVLKKYKSQYGFDKPFYSVRWKDLPLEEYCEMDKVEGNDDS